VIANVTSPAVLIEGGFLTKRGCFRLASEDYREQLPQAVSDGIYLPRLFKAASIIRSAAPVRKSAEISKK